MILSSKQVIITGHCFLYTLCTLQRKHLWNICKESIYRREKNNKKKAKQSVPFCKKKNEHKRRQQEEKTDKISTEKIENINKTAIASILS